jgi:hypothetical protein
MSKADRPSIEASPGRVLRWLGLLSAGLVAVFLFCLGLAGSASAEVDPTFFQELPTTQQHAATDFFYEQSPQSTVPYEGGAAELSESISHTYESQSESQPFYEELVGDVNEVGQDDELFPPVEDAVPEIWAASGAFTVGWKIGEGLDSLFALVGLGPDSAPEPEYVPGYSFCYSERCGSELHYEPYGTSLWEGKDVQQHPGAYVYSGELFEEGRSGGGYFPYVRWFQGKCDEGFSALNPPPEATVQGDVATGVTCLDPPLEGEFEYYLAYPYIPIQKLLSREEFHHYDPLIDPAPGRRSESPANPGTRIVEEKAAEDIDESEFDQAYITEVVEPEPSHEYFPAPTATEKKVDEEERRCDRGTPTFDNLGGNGSPGPFAVKEPMAFTVTDLPEGVESPSPVYLRWGETTWVGEAREEPEFYDLWGGWGFRHIAAKHGWNALDRAETEEALLRVQVPEKRGDKYIYTALDSAPGVGEVECERKVAVQFEVGANPKTEIEDPVARGIVSSFNAVK